MYPTQTSIQRVRGAFPRGVKLTTHPHLAIRLRMSRTIPALPHTPPCPIHSHHSLILLTRVRNFDYLLHVMCNTHHHTNCNTGVSPRCSCATFPANWDEGVATMYDISQLLTGNIRIIRWRHICRSTAYSSLGSRVARKSGWVIGPSQQ
jgi:hypothetical protein